MHKYNDVFHGDIDTRVVTLTSDDDVRVITPDRSKAEIFDYGIKVFRWGHGGPGATQLAASILLEVVPELRVIQVYQRFKLDVIMNLDSDLSFELPVRDVKSWVTACIERDRKPSEEKFTVGEYGGVYG